MPELWPWFQLVLVLSVGIFVQAAAGFAAGMLVVPTLMWMGYGIPEASMALMVATIPQNLFGVYSLRDSIVPRRLIWPGAGRLLFFPVGIIVLKAMEESLPTEQIRQIVGAVVLAATFATIAFKPTPRERLSPFWGWLAFPMSGFLQGLVGMGGPAMVFWVNAHDWGPRQIRGFLFAMYLISLAPAIAILFWYFRVRVLDAAIGATLAVPVLLLVTSWGLRFGNWLGRERLRGVTLALLLLTGIVGLASPWIRAL